MSGSTSNAVVAGVKAEQFLVKPEECATEEYIVKKETRKHRDIKNMIRETKLMAHPISSFGS